MGLAPPDPAIGLAHVDTVVEAGSTVTITGTGFLDPLVNLFTAAGNLGPLTPLAGGTATQVAVIVPPSAPTGPGNFQLVNRPAGLASNAVAAVIGDTPTITGVVVSGSFVTVTGTGFSALSVINLFAMQGGVLVNVGGLGPAGPRIPLSVVGDTRLTFTRPNGVDAGSAFVEVLNPPFTPFSTSGSDPDGAFTFPAPDTTLTVDDDGMASDTDCDDTTAAFTTVSSAILSAVAGDTVRVCPGTYGERLDFRGKAIAVESTDGPEVTTIDGGGTDSVVVFNHGEGRASRLTGFTVTNGNTLYWGGGINIHNTSPTITGNRITGNKACSGSGIDVSFGSPLIRGNLITGNTQAACAGGSGGGIAIGGAASAEVVGNVISDNIRADGAGGISLFDAGTPTITGNVIAGNRGSDAGGLSLYNWSDALIAGNLIVGNRGLRAGGIIWAVASGDRGPLLVNNTIADNDGPQASGIVASGFQSGAALVGNIIVAKAGQHAILCESDYSSVAPSFGFNDVFAASGTAYGGFCADQTGTNGNISADPLFASPSHGDFHLRAGSPAIDAGDDAAPGLPATDIDGTLRRFDGDADGVATVDIGADEYSDLMASLTVARPSLVGCLTTTGRVTLIATAETGGVVVALASDNPHVTLPASLTVPTGAIEARFSIATDPVAIVETATISGRVPGQILSAALTINPVAPKSVALSPNPVVGGASVAANVTLECAAGPGDVVVTLTSSKPLVAAPATTSIIVPAGTRVMPFEVTTNPVTVVTKPVITATANGVTKSKALTVSPAP